MNGDYDSDDFKGIQKKEKKKEKKKEEKFLNCSSKLCIPIVLAAHIFHLNGYSFSL